MEVEESTKGFEKGGNAGRSENRTNGDALVRSLRSRGEAFVTDSGSPALRLPMPSANDSTRSSPRPFPRLLPPPSTPFRPLFPSLSGEEIYSSSPSFSPSTPSNSSGTGCGVKSSTVTGNSGTPYLGTFPRVLPPPSPIKPSIPSKNEKASDSPSFSSSTISSSAEPRPAKAGDDLTAVNIIKEASMTENSQTLSSFYDSGQDVQFMEMLMPG